MWQKFTEEARLAILRAQEEAGKVRSLDVDTEHLLLGLFAVDENRVTRLLKMMGVDAANVRAQVTQDIAHHSRRTDSGEPKLTPDAKRVLEFSADEARRASHRAIDVEHLLLALIRQTKGVASRILLEQGADLGKARTVVAYELEIGQQRASYHITPLSGIEFKQEIADVLGGALHWANLSHGSIGAEELLLSLLERRADLGVEILGLDGLALKKARLQLLVRLDMYEQATTLRKEIESEQS